MSKKIIAHDLGTGGNKATLFDSDGTLIDSVFASYPTSTPGPNLIEQKPDDWLCAAAQSTKQLLAETGVDPHDVAAMAISGHSLGAVPLDKGGNLLRDETPIWSDRRAEAEAAAFFQRIDPTEWYLITGNGFPAAHYSAFKILWYKEHEPEMFRETDIILGTKDYLNYRLTGVRATDPSYASGSGIYDLQGWKYSEDLLAASGLDPNLFPKIVPSTEPLGPLTAEGAELMGLTPETVVCCGGVDNSCMALGAGSFKKGRLYTSLGSSSWIALCDSSPTLDVNAKSYVFTHVVPGMFTSALSIFSSGTTFRWVRDRFCRDLVEQAEASGADIYDLMTAEAANSPAGARGLLCNPSLAGGTLLDANPSMRGGFANLDLLHTRADVIRATMEGIAMNMRGVMDALRKIAATEKSLIAVGGGANSPLWRQIYADTLNMDILRINIGQNAASLGAAALAFVGTGLWDSFDRIDDLLHPETSAKPDPEAVKVYDAAYPKFRKFADALGQLT
jgi:xylulokinase